MRDRQKWSFGLTAVVLIVCIVLFLNYSSRRIFRRDQEQPHSFDGEEYLTAVEERGEVQLLVDKSNVKSIVEQMEPPEQFYWSTATTLTSEDGAKESTCRYWQKGDRAKAELLDGETLVQTVLRTGDTVTVRKTLVTYSFRVLALVSSRQGAKNVPEYMEDITPPEELNKLNVPRETIFVQRDRGMGRPTKRERREIDALMGDLSYSDEEE